MTKITKADIKEFAFHLRTIGAFVQTPIPSVVGLPLNHVIGSVDAKSLYPTIMGNGNIGYDSLFGRVYDASIVGSTIGYIKMIFARKASDPTIVKKGYDKFKSNLLQSVSSFTSRKKVKSAAKLKAFTPDYYGQLFLQIISYQGQFENICNPQTDTEYILLKSCLFPILEAITWMHSDNRGYNNTLCDYMFNQVNFEQNYKDTTFYVFDNVNSTRTKFREFAYPVFKEYYLTKFNLNPYGTLFYRHYDFKSFEVDNIFRGMSSRKTVKDQGLILKAICEHWDELTKPETMSFYDTQEKIENKFAESIIQKVGDLDPKKRNSQLKSLTGIDFNIKNIVDKRQELTGRELEYLIKVELTGIYEYKDSYQNGEKTSLNSGYGLFAMVTWDWFQVLVSNSITTGGKIAGIKLFQQIASNIMRNERISKNIN